MQVEHVDFVSFLTQDIQRARGFYADGETIETGVYRQPDGNALMLHRRFDA